MKKLLLAFALLTICVTQGQAQNSTKKEKIKNLFVVMHQDSLMIKTLDAMSTSMVQSMSTMFADTMFTNHGVDGIRLTQRLLEKNMQRSKEMAL